MNILAIIAVVLLCVGFTNQDETQTEISESTQTSPLLSLQMFRNGSVQLIEPLLGNTSNTGHDSIQYDNQTLENQIRSRERLKKERLLNIQAQILRRLGLVGRIPIATVNVTASSLNDEVGRKIIDVVNNRPPPTSNTYLEDQFLLPNDPNSGGVAVTDTNKLSTSEIYAQRLQSFYSSCEVPNATDVRLWNSIDKQQMKLYFDVTIPKSTNARTHITIMWAKLRLYMYARPECTQNKLGTETDTSAYVEMMTHCESNTLTISLYQYMRPLKPNRKERRRLLDSRTVPVSYGGNVEFNMQSVINYWQNMHHRNYGLMVQIEDAFGNILTPSMYIKQMNCSDYELPIPNLADLYGKDVLNETVNAISRNRSCYPTLDLMTMETARDELSQSMVELSSSLQKPTVNTVYRKVITNDFD